MTGPTARATTPAAPPETGAPASVALQRLLSLVLALDETRPVSAAQLAERAGSSLRTVYRDVRRLQAAGVPIVAEPGRSGGLLLAPGYRLAPLGLTRGETLALAVAIQVLRALPTQPFRAELESAARKIASATRVERPELLADVGTWLRIEPPAADVFHPEREAPRPPDAEIGGTVQRFIEALIAGRSLRIDYHSPYAAGASSLHVAPAGVVADRGLWYLVVFARDALRPPRYLRADRVRRCTPAGRIDLKRRAAWQPELTRPWLQAAMKLWTEGSPITLEISAAQWQALQRDWFFGTGRFEKAAQPDRLLFTWGENDFERVRELLAWLGPPARLVEPVAWRERMQAALQAHARLQVEPAADFKPKKPRRTGAQR